MKYSVILYIVSVLYIPTISNTQTWIARYDGPGSGYDAATAIAVDNAGNVYVTGYSPGLYYTNDYATVKYDSLGNEVWVARYDPPENMDDIAFDLALYQDTYIYVTGYSGSEAGVYDYATVKYDSAGTELWTVRYNGPGNHWDRAEALVVDESGDIYVTGFSPGIGTDNDYATVKYDSAGNELWVARYNGPGNYHDAAVAITLDDQGDIYITGNSSGSITYADLTTVRYDPAGNEIWVARYNGPAGFHDAGNAVVTDDLCNVYVTGYSADSDTVDDIVTVKYDAAGNELWAMRYNGPANGFDRAYALVLDNACNVYVAGYSYGIGTTSDITVIKYDSSGTELWVARYNGPGNGSDVGFDIALDAAGNVYVAGFSTGSGTFGDYIVIMYDPSGIQQWIARYNGPGDHFDIINEITLDAADNVYVTGYSISTGVNFDYATLRYLSPGVAEHDVSTIQNTRHALTVFPNPFYAKTIIHYHCDSNKNIDLAIRDVTGRLVRRFYGQSCDHRISVIWDGKDEKGKRLPGGIYFVCCANEMNMEVQKLVLLR
jgi:hypothetical protein